MAVYVVYAEDASLCGVWHMHRVGPYAYAWSIEGPEQVVYL